MAGFSQRLMADEKGLPGGFDDLWGERVEFVHSLYAFDLSEQPVDEAEVAGGDPHDGGDGCGVDDVAVRCLARVASPDAGNRLVRTAVSSSGVSWRYSWANPMRL